MGKTENAPTPWRTDPGNAIYSQVSSEERKDAAKSIRRSKIPRHPGVRKEIQTELEERIRKKMGKDRIRWIKPGGYSAMDSRKTANTCM